MSKALRYNLLAILSLACLVQAHGSEDHSSHGTSSSSSSSSHGAHAMTPYFHFTPLTDTVWFEGWAPSTAGAVVGTCIGLFLLGIVERWVEACGVLLAASTYNRHTIHPKQPSGLAGVFLLQSVPPFSIPNDLLRGAVYAVQAALGFALMLVVMTYQVGFILSIVAGLGVGEVIFGRYIWSLGKGKGH